MAAIIIILAKFPCMQCFVSFAMFFVISEDIDPTVGKFRNMVQTTILVPNKVHSMLLLQECIQMSEIHDTCGDPGCKEKS